MISWYSKYPNHYAEQSDEATTQLGEMRLEARSRQLADSIKALKADKVTLQSQNEFYNQSQSRWKQKNGIDKRQKNTGTHFLNVPVFFNKQSFLKSYSFTLAITRTGLSSVSNFLTRLLYFCDETWDIIGDNDLCLAAFSKKSGAL